MPPPAAAYHTLASGLGQLFGVGAALQACEDAHIRACSHNSKSGTRSTASKVCSITKHKQQ